MRKLLAVAVILFFAASIPVLAQAQKSFKPGKHGAKIVAHHNKHKTGPASNSQPSSVSPHVHAQK